MRLPAFANTFVLLNLGLPGAGAVLLIALVGMAAAGFTATMTQYKTSDCTGASEGGVGTANPTCTKDSDGDWTKQVTSTSECTVDSTFSLYSADSEAGCQAATPLVEFKMDGKCHTMMMGSASYKAVCGSATAIAASVVGIVASLAASLLL